MFKSHKSKIILSFLFIEIIFLSIIIAYNYFSIQSFTNDILHNEIKTEKKLFTKLIETPLITYDLATLDELTNSFTKLENVKSVSIFDTNNILLSKSIIKNEINNTKDNIQTKRETKLLKNNNDNIYTYKKERIIDNEKNLLGYASFSFDLSKVTNIIEEHTKNIISIAIFEILLSILVSFLIARKLSENLEEINNALNNFKPGKRLNLNIDTNDEFGKIAKTISSLDEKLKTEMGENLKKEQILLEQYKQAEMGGMMASILHQWRQPLNIISLTNSVLKMNVELEDYEKEEMEETVQTIETQINEMLATINDFRDYFNPNKERQEYSLKNIIYKVHDMIGDVYIANGIKINIIIKEDLHTFGFENEIKQAIINIMNNARDEILKNKCRNMNIDLILTKENNLPILFIKDYAGGIPENIIDKIFEPYFTTKGDAEGTGIGLDMTKKIVEKNNARIEVTNHTTEINGEVVTGAIFKLVFRQNIK
jgi:signal transduction histidine kinase